MKRAVVISAGAITDYGYIAAFIHEGDFVICADGGIAHAEKMGVTPQLSVGDFDSFKENLTGEVIKFNPEKDFTDTHLAVCEALKRGFDEIVLLGATGGRIDHTLSNLGLLEFIADNGAKGYVIDEKNKIELVRGKAVIKEEKGYVSLVPVGTVKGVTLKDFKYSLTDYDLKFSESVAISNEFVGCDGVIEVKEGSLLVIKSRD